MNVKTVGASSHVSTIVTLGVTPQLMEEVEKISVDLVAVSRKQAETAKDISYLNGKLKDGSITPRQKERLAKLKLEAPIHNLKEKRHLPTSRSWQMPADSGRGPSGNRDQYRGL